MIAIIDYGIGNLASIQNIIKHVGGAATITRDVGALREASGLILPGVGSFDACMKALNASRVRETVERRVREEATPMLGICVGMQMMARGSEEGVEPGLAWFEASVKKLAPDPALGLKVPNMGWRFVSTKADDPLFAGANERQRFYFVHSYHVVCDNTDDVSCSFEYGGPITAGIRRDNINAVQFHPEKSHAHGMRLYLNFLKTCGHTPARYDAI